MPNHATSNMTMADFLEYRFSAATAMQWLRWREMMSIIFAFPIVRYHSLYTRYNIKVHIK